MPHGKTSALFIFIVFVLGALTGHVVERSGRHFDVLGEQSKMWALSANRLS